MSRFRRVLPFCPLFTGPAGGVTPVQLALALALAYANAKRKHVKCSSKPDQCPKQQAKVGMKVGALRLGLPDCIFIFN